MTGHFAFDDRDIAFVDGQSVAGALIGSGVYSWRTTRRTGRPRGVFCGIGVCFDCLITIDGVPNQLACLAAATAGATVTSQIGTGHGDDRG